MLDIGHFKIKTEVLGNAFAEFWSPKQSMDLTYHTLPDNNEPPQKIVFATKLAEYGVQKRKKQPARKFNILWSMLTRHVSTLAAYQMIAKLLSRIHLAPLK